MIIGRSFRCPLEEPKRQREVEVAVTFQIAVDVAWERMNERASMFDDTAIAEWRVSSGKPTRGL